MDQENVIDLQKRIWSLERAAKYFKHICKEQDSKHIEMIECFTNIEKEIEKLFEEKTSQMCSLEAKQKWMESKLQQTEEEVKTLKQALRNKGTDPKLDESLLDTKVRWIKVMTDKILRDNNNHWSQRMESREQQMAAEKEAFCKSQKEVVSKLTSEIDNLKTTLREQKTREETAKSFAISEELRIKEEKNVAAQMAALQEENERKLNELRWDYAEAATTALLEKMTLTEKIMDKESRLRKLHKEMYQKEVNFQKQYQALADQMKIYSLTKERWVSKKDKGLDQHKMTKQNLMALHELTSRSNRAKAKKKTEKKTPAAIKMTKKWVE